MAAAAPAIPAAAAIMICMRRVGPSRAIEAVAAVRETYEETGLVFGTLGADKELIPRLDCIDLLGRSITPESKPIRYSARVFTADAEHATGEIRSNGELEDLHWRPIADSFTLPMVDVTQWMLMELFRRYNAGDKSAFTHIPIFQYAGDKPSISYE